MTKIMYHIEFWNGDSTDDIEVLFSALNFDGWTPLKDDGGTWLKWSKAGATAYVERHPDTTKLHEA